MSSRGWVRGEREARAHRHLLRLGVEPINIWDQIRSTGVPFSRKAFGEDGPDGLYIREKHRSMIIVNRDKDSSRQRWTAAHELGHHVMHAAVLRDFAIADEDVFAAGSDNKEKEADGFAAYFLAPSESILESWNEFAGDQPSAAAVVKVMARFGISFEATLWRLLNSHAIARDQLDVLKAAGRGNVVRLKQEIGYDEEAVFAAGPDLPEEAIVEPALRLWASRVITEDRLATLLRIETAEAMERASDRGISRAEIPDFGEIDLDELLSESDDAAPPE